MQDKFILLESGIPGSKVGYMPQELALYKEFTISETLHFFGRVHRMTGKSALQCNLIELFHLLRLSMLQVEDKYITDFNSVFGRQEMID